MTATTSAHQAAAILLNNWKATTRIAALPEHCRPASRADGYATAAAVAEASGQPVAGWKIAATSEAGQKHINVEGPLIGRILRHRLLPPGAAVTLGDNIMRVAEAEFAFGFGKDVPPRAKPYDIEEALEAVSSLHLSIEIPDSRYSDFTKVGSAQLIADTACASWLVLGPAIAVPWRHIDLLVLRPSRDLGRLANEFEADLPRAFRFLVRGLGSRQTRSNDMLSLLMFQPDYLARMVELGEADALARADEIDRFLEAGP